MRFALKNLTKKCTPGVTRLDEERARLPDSEARAGRRAEGRAGAVVPRHVVAAKNVSGSAEMNAPPAGVSSYRVSDESAFKYGGLAYLQQVPRSPRARLSLAGVNTLFAPSAHSACCKGKNSSRRAVTQLCDKFSPLT